MNTKLIIKNISIYLIAIIMLISILYRVLIPPVLGIANNGDFERIYLQSGLNYSFDPYLQENRDLAFFKYVTLKYKVIPPIKTYYFSSYEFNIGVSKILNSFISKDGLYDIRTLGFVSSIMLFFGFCLTIFGLKKISVSPRIFAVISLALIFIDVSVVQYFNSFYTELGTVIYSLFFFAFLLIYIRKRTEFKHIFYKIALLILMLVSGFMACTAKSQDIAFVLPISLLLLIVLWDIVNSIFSKSKLAKGLTFFITSGILLLIFVNSCISVNSKKTITGNQSLYNVIFQEIAIPGEKPEVALEALGFLDNDAKDLSMYAGTDAYVSNTGAVDPLVEAYLGTVVSYTDVVKYFITHPKNFITMANERSKAMFLNSSYNPALALKGEYMPSLGNFEKSFSGETLKISTSLNYWSEFKKNSFPRSLLFIAFVLTLSCFLSIFFIYRIKNINFSNKLLNVHLINIVLIMMALLQFVFCMIGDSRRDDLKHLFMFNMLFDVSLLFTVLYLVKVVIILAKKEKFMAEDEDILLPLKYSVSSNSKKNSKKGSKKNIKNL